MAKYDALRDYLAKQRGSELRMTFSDVERLVGDLPESARVHRAWWANDSKVEALAWRTASWHVSSVDQAAESVVFVRGTAPRSSPAAKHAAVGPTGSYVDAQVIANIKASVDAGRFDYTKLLRLIEELNDNHRRGNGYAAHALLRAILDHVPPMLGCADFNAVAGSYSWSRTDKVYIRRLLDFKLQAHDVMHRQISKRPDVLSMEDMPPRAWVNRLLQECAG